MCLEVLVIFLGCGCQIKSPTNDLLGIQPCTSPRPPIICDVRLNGRARYPFFSPATRFPPIWCAAHVKAGADEIGDDGKELLPTVYASVQEFLDTDAFDNNKLIERVKKHLAVQWRVAQLLKRNLEQLDVHQRQKEEQQREAKARADAERATAEREEVERRAGGTLGALRPNLGRGFAALGLHKRRDEAKAHEVLEQTLVKKAGEVAQETRNVQVAGPPVPNPDKATPRADRSGLKRWIFPHTTERHSLTRNHASPATTTATGHASGQKDAPPPKDLSSRVTAASKVTPSQAAPLKDTSAKNPPVHDTTRKIASSRPLPVRPKPKDKPSDAPSKVIDLDGVDLYE